MSPGAFLESQRLPNGLGFDAVVDSLELICKIYTTPCWYSSPIKEMEEELELNGVKKLFRSTEVFAQKLSSSTELLKDIEVLTQKLSRDTELF